MRTITAVPHGRVVLLAVAAVLAATSFALAAPSAHAGVLDATCQGTVQTTFSPGLRLVSQTIASTDTTTLGTCVSASEPAVASASSFASYSAAQSCLAPVNSGPVTETLHWSTGQTSTFVSTAALTAVAGQSVSTQTGTITAGLFAGDTAVKVTASPALDLLACASAQGIPSRTGTATLEITG